MLAHRMAHFEVSHFRTTLTTHVQCHYFLEVDVLEQLFHSSVMNYKLAQCIYYDLFYKNNWQQLTKLETVSCLHYSNPLSPQIHLVKTPHLPFIPSSKF